MFEELAWKLVQDRPAVVAHDLQWAIKGALAVEFDYVNMDLHHPADGALMVLELMQRRMQRIEAGRIVALLDAYQAGMADLADRYGTDATARDGLPGRTFLKQAAMILRCAERTAARLLDTATELRESLPLTWAAFTSGETTWRSVDIAVRESVGLDAQALPAFDEVAADLVVTGTAGRLADRLRRARERLQSDTAAARAAVTHANRRVDLDPMPDGEAALTIRGPAVKLVAFDHALTQAAVGAHGHPDEQRGIGALRFDIALDLLLGGVAQAAHPEVARPDAAHPKAAHVAAAHPDAGSLEAAHPTDTNIAGRVPQRTAVVPTVAVTIPALAWLGHTTEQAILAGYGPIDLDTARELCADAPSMLRVLTDPVTGVRMTMDRKAYAPPPDLKRWLRIRDEQCAGLGCRRPAHLCDIDHVAEWHEGGITEEANLVHLCRRCHLVKSSGLWTEALKPDRTVTWTSPWRRTYPGDPPELSDPAPAHLLPNRTDDLDDCPF